MSDFVALYTAFSGLRAAQTAMDTASHNIANAANPAYPRLGSPDGRMTSRSTRPWSTTPSTRVDNVNDGPKRRSAAAAVSNFWFDAGFRV